MCSGAVESRAFRAATAGNGTARRGPSLRPLVHRRAPGPRWRAETAWFSSSAETRWAALARQARHPPAPAAVRAREARHPPGAAPAPAPPAVRRRVRAERRVRPAALEILAAPAPEPPPE